MTRCLIDPFDNYVTILSSTLIKIKKFFFMYNWNELYLIMVNSSGFTIIDDGNGWRQYSSGSMSCSKFKTIMLWRNYRKGLLHRSLFCCRLLASQDYIYQPGEYFKRRQQSKCFRKAKAALCSFTASTDNCCCSLLWYNNTENNMPQHWNAASKDPKQNIIQLGARTLCNFGTIFRIQKP